MSICTKVPYHMSVWEREWEDFNVYGRLAHSESALLVVGCMQLWNMLVSDIQ